MWAQGGDVCVRAQLRAQCPRCAEAVVLHLVERSRYGAAFWIPFRSGRRYHLICMTCSSIFPVSEAERKGYYRTLWERLFGN